MLLTSIFSFIIELPLEVYDTFVVEQKHGFNKQVRFLIVPCSYVKVGRNISVDKLITHLIFFRLPCFLPKIN